MRRWIRSCGAVVIVALVGGVARAEGPQFTGLLNVYNSGTGLQERHNSLARMDLEGPIAGTVVQLNRNWSDIIVPPDNHAWYTLTSQEVHRVDPVTGVATHLPINVPEVAPPDTGWTVGATWDTNRNRLVVGTLSGQGYFFGYFNSSNQWNYINSLQGVDLGAVLYRPADDIIYAIPNHPFDTSVRELFKFNSMGQRVGTLPLSRQLPLVSFTAKLDWQMLLASDGQFAVIVPQEIPSGTGGSNSGSMLYLINPDTGAITYEGVLPVPEAGAAALMLVGACLLRRQRNRG